MTYGRLAYAAINAITEQTGPKIHYRDEADNNAVIESQDPNIRQELFQNIWRYIVQMQYHYCHLYGCTVPKQRKQTGIHKNKKIIFKQQQQQTV